MRLIFRLITFGVIALVALAACAPNDSTEATSSSSIDLGVVVSEPEPSDSGGMYPRPDLSLLTHTGQPQFLNAYANW